MLSKELIIRGNKSDKIIEYFEGVALKECGEKGHTFIFNHKDLINPKTFNYKVVSKNWVVELTHEKDIFIGKMSFPEVVVRISADESRLEDVIYQFRIQFLSAGG